MKKVIRVSEYTDKKELLNRLDLFGNEIPKYQVVNMIMRSYTIDLIKCEECKHYGVDHPKECELDDYVKLPYHYCGLARKKKR